MSRHSIGFIAACLVCQFESPNGAACPPCVSSLADEAADCDFIIFGTLENARTGAAGDSTDLVISHVLKHHPLLVGRRVIQIPHYMPSPDPTKPQTSLAFGAVNKDGIDVYRGVPGKEALVDYVRGLLTIDRTDRIQMLRYCFDYLEHREREISNDAHAEYSKAEDREIQAVARAVHADKLRRWLQDEETSQSRLGLYAMLLAHGGDQRDAALLRKLLDRSLDLSCMHQVLTGYTILKPKEGWELTRAFLKSPARTFIHRYAALKTARYFWTNRPELVAEKDILEGVAFLLDQDDISDLAIEFLRERHCWSMTERILPLYRKRGDDARHIRRNVIRYALECPDAQATRFIADLSKSEPAAVEAIVETLKAEVGVAVGP